MDFLPLDLSHVPASGATLQHLITSYFVPEDDKGTCNQCGAARRRQKSLADGAHPQFSFVVLKRFVTSYHDGQCKKVRTPVIPGFNDSPAAIRAIATFVGGLPRPVPYELLPYHRFGEAKYRELGRDYPLPDLDPPSAEQMAALSAAADEARSAALRDRT